MLQKMSYDAKQTTSPSQSIYGHVYRCQKRSLVRHAFDNLQTEVSTLTAVCVRACVYTGFVTSIFSIGGLIGAISAGPISDRYGRKNALLFNCIFFIIGPAFEALAQTQWTLAFGRILSGFGSGSSLVVAPIYVHDIAPPEYGGFL